MYHRVVLGLIRDVYGLVFSVLMYDDAEFVVLSLRSFFFGFLLALIFLIVDGFYLLDLKISDNFPVLWNLVQQLLYFLGKFGLNLSKIHNLLLDVKLQALILNFLCLNIKVLDF